MSEIQDYLEELYYTDNRAYSRNVIFIAIMENFSLSSRREIKKMEEYYLNALQAELKAAINRMDSYIAEKRKEAIKQ